MAKQRQANIELLRIIAMFMIIMIHANCGAISWPTTDEMLTSPLSTFSRYLFESIGIVSVNVFILISGWFTITVNKLKTLSFVYQVLFFNIGIYILFVATGLERISLSGISGSILNTGWDWFIKAYIVLMILAPVLNAFLKDDEEIVHRNVVMYFFLFSFVYGWIGGARRFFVAGYGPLSFIGLYLLSNYINKVKRGIYIPPHYINKLVNFNKYYYLISFILCTLALSIAASALTYIGKAEYVQVFYAYSNPLIIISAASLFLFFENITIKQSKLISFLAASSFTVYLFHDQPNIRSYFDSTARNIYEGTNGYITILSIGLFLCAVYLLAVLVDQLRIYSWKLINKYIK